MTADCSSEIDRLISDLSVVFNAGFEEEEIKRRASFYLMAFIGRVAVGDETYRSLSEVMPVLRDGREAIQKMPSRFKAVRFVLSCLPNWII